MKKELRDFMAIRAEADRLLAIHYNLPIARAAHLATFMAQVERGSNHPTPGDLGRAEDFLARREITLKMKG